MKRKKSRIPKPWELDAVQAREKDRVQAQVAEAPPKPQRKDAVPDVQMRPGWEKSGRHGRLSPKMRRVGIPEGLAVRQPLDARKINGMHTGETVFVLGSGKSLLALDEYPELLDRPCIGVNLIYLRYLPRYLLFLDRIFWDKDEAVLRELDTHIFCPKKFNTPFNSFYQLVGNTKGLMVSEDYEHGLVGSVNSIISALNLAYVMGASTIAMLGVELDNTEHFFDSSPECWETNAVLKKKKPYWRNKKDFPGSGLVASNLTVLGRWYNARGVQTILLNDSTVINPDIWKRRELKEFLQADG